MEVKCPDCGSSAFKKNGYTRHGKQNHRCLECGRQFSREIQELIQRDNAQFFSGKEGEEIAALESVEIAVR